MSHVLRATCYKLGYIVAKLQSSIGGWGRQRLRQRLRQRSVERGAWSVEQGAGGVDDREAVREPEVTTLGMLTIIPHSKGSDTLHKVRL
jgi:hypothetical protein